MRVMVQISLPVESGNKAIQNGTVDRLFKDVAERWKPEAMYFTTFDGKRTAFVVFDMSDASDIPSFAEPFFMEMNSEVMFAPVMDRDDLAKGLAKLR